MLRNEATWDRMLRVTAGMLAVLVGWTGIVGGTWAFAFLIVGFVLTITGLIGVCPLYRLFGFSTCRRT